MSCFVSIEGVEGAGKSTLRTRLCDALEALEVEVVITREPGATVLGQTVRSLVLDPKNQNLHPLTELMLFAADRSQHLEEVIRPALDRGALVLCDRYIHSTLAYQGYGRGLNLKSLNSLNEFVTQGLKPDLVLLLDLDPEVGLQRAQQRSRKASGTFTAEELQAAANGDSSLLDSGGQVDSGWTKFEQQKLDFHQRVRNGFLDLAQDPTNNMLKLDASASPEELSQKALQAIQKRLGTA